MTRCCFTLCAALLSAPAVGVAQDTTGARSQADLVREADSIRAAYADSIGQLPAAAETTLYGDSSAPGGPGSGEGGHPCAAGRVLESCRENTLHTALKQLIGSLRDPYSAKLDPQIVVTREEVPVVCGRVNAKNSYGGYTGMSVFVYSLLTLGVVVFPSTEEDAWKKDLTIKALKRCTEAGPNDFMLVPAEYQKYVDE